jgi:tetratricopeptide (TPR) repeat protein
MGKILKFEKVSSGNINKAEEIVWDAWAAEDHDEKLALAKKALKLDPGCTDAYNILGSEEKDEEKRLEYFTQAVESFTKRHDQTYFDETAGYFWGEPETRPFMRALLGYGQSLWDTIRPQEAIETLNYMLTLNPMDNQGVRYLLASWLLIVDDLKNARKLLKKHKEETAVMLFSALLLNILEKKNEGVIQKCYDAAVEANEYIVPYLLKKRKVPAGDFDRYSLGSKEEAVIYMDDEYGAAAWITHPEALKVLAGLAKGKK